MYGKQKFSNVSKCDQSTATPRIANEKDREFVAKLNAFIEKELGKINSDDPEQRYIVYKAAFDKIIDYVGAYKPLLTAIKAEYEDVIETIQRGQREALYLSGKLKAVASGPSTLRNYRKRADELDNNISVIQCNNDKLKEQIRALREARESKDRKNKEVPEVAEKYIKRDKRAIPGLTLQQSTDPKTLSKELDKLDRQLKEMSLAYRTRFVPKENKDILKEHLASKVTLRDQLAEKTDILKYKGQKLKVAVEAAQAYMNIQPPHQTIGDAVVNALHRANTQGVLQKDDGTTTSVFEEDDPAKEKEAEIMLEYIEKFTELMEDQKYEQAAVHAANSPKGILRTVETMVKFKDSVTKTSKGRSPLLAFCDALLATVPAYGVTPNETISLEAVQCALHENRLDLLAHWVTQNRLSLSQSIGDAIWEYASTRQKAVQNFAICQHIYSSLKLHHAAIKCMVVQGKVKQAIQYANTKASFSTTDFVELLDQFPNQEMVQALTGYEASGKPLVPVITAAVVLMEKQNDEMAMNLVEHLRKPHHSDEFPYATKLRNEIFDDTYATPDQMISLAKLSDKIGYTEASVELTAASVVKEAMKNAKQIVLCSESVTVGRTITPKKPSRLRFASSSESESSEYPDSSDY